MTMHSIATRLAMSIGVLLTSSNLTRGDEQTLLELKRYAAPEAHQAVAVDSTSFYAITNRAIAHYNKDSGKPISKWTAADDSPIRHLNSGLIHNGRLYCTNSNWPKAPLQNSVEIFAADSLKHLERKEFPDTTGAINWIDRHHGAWWIVFAFYGEREVRRTRLVRYDDQWRETGVWSFPAAVTQRFLPHSNSGGAFGPDGMLYVTGHDRSEIYVLEVPKKAGEMRHVTTLAAPIAGQGIAWDRSRIGRLFGIVRSKQEVVSMRLLADESRVKVIKNVSYLGAGRSEKLDLYLPGDESSRKRPAVVIVHGGGWQGGDKSAKREQNIGTNLARAGYVCASINYRLCQKNENLAARLREVWPGNLYDCKTAVRFLRSKADEYRIDADHIGAIGGSAGGHLVAMMAVTDADDGLDPKEPYGEYSCRIQAVVPMYGVHDVPLQAKSKGQTLSEEELALCRNASPVTWVTADDPPALILHGTNDALVPVKQTTILQKRLLAAGVASKRRVIIGAPHSFHLQPKQRDLRAEVIGFFDRHLKPKPSVKNNSHQQ